jgi:DNA polymerase-3 subunit alpha
VAIPDAEFAKREKLAFEKEMLGLYVSDHPLMGAEAALRRRCDCTITDVADLTDGAVVKVGGVCTSLARKYTRKGDLMAVFTLEDLQSQVEVMVFPKTMHSVGHLLADDAAVVVSGRVDNRDETAKLIAMDVEVFDGIVDGAPPLRLTVVPHALSERMLDRLERVLAQFPGDSPVFVHLGDDVVRLPDDYCVDVGTGLLGELRVLLGPSAIV